MIAEFESRILALIDGMVDHASDDEVVCQWVFAWPPDISHRRTGKW